MTLPSLPAPNELNSSDSESSDSLTEDLNTLETNASPKHAICSTLFTKKEEWFAQDPFEIQFKSPLINQTELVIWLARKRLIPNQSFCEKCRIKPMVLDVELAYCDNYSWRCSWCKKHKTLRERSLFAKSPLSLQVQMNILYMWALDYTLDDILRISMSNKPTVLEWLDEITKVCAWAVRNTLDRLQTDVELREAPILSDQALRVLAGCERSSDRFFIAHLPKNMDAQFLEHLLENYLEPQSVVSLIDGTLIKRFPNVVKYYKSSNFTVNKTAQSDKLNKLLQDLSDHVGSIGKFHIERFPLLVDEFVWRKQCGDKRFASICYALARISTIS